MKIRFTYTAGETWEGPTWEGTPVVIEADSHAEAQTLFFESFGDEVPGFLKYQTEVVES